MRPVGRSGDRTDAGGGRPRYPSGQGSPDVTVNRRSALRVGDPILDDRGTYRNGEATVLVNGRPLVARGDDASCDRRLVEASGDVEVGQGNIGSPGRPPGILFHIHVDADRDGRVDDDFSRNGTWDGGRGRYGAVLPVNADDDSVTQRPNVGGAYPLDGDTRRPREDHRKPAPASPDGSDTAETEPTAPRTLTAASDLLDLAPIDLRRDPRTAGRSTAGWKLVVTVSREHKIRIFDGRAVGGAEIIGPVRGARYEITDIDRDRYEWSMEGTQFPGRFPRAGTDRDPIELFDGKVVITLEVWDPTATMVHTEQCRVRATPWVMFNHFDPTDEVIVAHAPSPRSPVNNNEAMRTELQAALPEGVKLTVVQNMNDRWAQDVMEPGYASLARTATPERWSMPVVLRSARNRGEQLERMARQMCGPDFGFAQAEAPGAYSSLDSFGNLECTPPYGEYPFGRIVYGTNSPDVRRFLDDQETDPDPGMRGAVIAFLEAQAVQAPIAIETGWLMVGHVDEIFSFLPMRDARLGFRLVYASAGLALSMLEELARQAPPDTTTMRWALASGVDDADLPLSIILALRHLRAVTQFVDGRITRARQQLMTAIGLTQADCLAFPVLFNGRSRRDGVMVCDPLEEVVMDPVADGVAFDNCVAQMPGVVNGLVVTRGEPTLGSRREITYVMPRPYGPQQRGRCIFEERIRTTLGASTVSGVTPAFIDDFFSYHTMQGEVHCGTNSVRKPPTDRFWWEYRQI